MTYCLGMLLDQGLIMMTDSRTNAGVDNVSSYQKLHPLVQSSDREIWIACCGSLSATQAMLGMLEEPSGPEAHDPTHNLNAARSMFRAAQIVGVAVRRANQAIDEALGRTGKSRSSFLLGGRIGSQPPQLFEIYAEGNSIECKPRVPFLQIGETKYGRPILDRIISRSTPLSTAVKIAFLSFDSAMRSNLSVARPLDLLVMPNDAGRASLTRRIESDDPYFNALSARWSALLFEATCTIEDPDFMGEFDRPRPLEVVRDLRG